MNSTEKIEYVRKQISEKAAISPSGPISLYLYTVTHPDSEEWVILTRGEQQLILKKLEELGEIKNLEWKDERSLDLEIVSNAINGSFVNKLPDAFHITFDEKTSNIIVNGVRNIGIEIGTNLYRFCKYMFSQPAGEKINETRILDADNWNTESKRAVYDAMLKVNARFVAEMNTPLFEHSKSNFYFADKIARKIDKEPFVL